ncbi:hypothetical protein HDE_00014 [Halotydeus destructor]|nr:hypothetical protein HDE_00014 [Halotydeus destructor]
MSQTSGNGKKNGGHVPSSNHASNSEAKFYGSVAQKVAENLLYHVDGRLKQNHKRETSKVENIASVSSYAVDLTKYNFPADFKYNSTVGSTDKKLNFMMECDLKTKAPASLSSTRKTVQLTATKETLVCSVCGHHLQSMALFNQHTSSTHPNVYCTYYRLSPERDVPNDVLCWQFNSPQGILSQTPLIPTPKHSIGSSSLMKCTRCSTAFDSREGLHDHLFVCVAGVEKSKSEAGSLLTNSSSVSNSPVTRSRVRRTPTEPTLPSELSPAKKVRKQLNFTPPKREPIKRDRNNNSSETEKPAEPVTRLTCKKCLKSFTFASSLSKHEVTCRKKNIQPSAAGTEISSKPQSRTSRKRSVVTTKSDDEKCPPEASPGNHFENHCARCDRSFRNNVIYCKHIESCNRSKEAKDKSGDDDIPEKKSRTQIKAIAKSAQNETLVLTVSTVNILPLEAMRTDELLRKVKEDNPQFAFKGSPAQHHSCPYCQRGFTYLANYRRHIKENCPIRRQTSDNKILLNSKSTDGPGSSQIVTESNKPTKGKFRPSSCNICHKIFLSQFEMLRHRLSHKLNETTLSMDSMDEVDKLEKSREELAAKLLENSAGEDSVQKRNPSNNSKPIDNLLETLARGGAEKPMETDVSETYLSQEAVQNDDDFVVEVNDADEIGSPDMPGDNYKVVDNLSELEDKSSLVEVANDTENSSDILDESQLVGSVST